MAEIHRSESAQERDAFGHWLSGFVDGEGSFIIAHKLTREQRYPAPYFAISLRQDDLAIVQQIRAYLGCGNIILGHWRTRGKDDCQRMPVVNFNVTSRSDMATTLIPHFERYPLRAKKARDFRIWREAVLLCYRVGQRKRIGLASGRGTKPRWEEADLVEFAALKAQIRETRRYETGGTLLAAKAQVPPARPAEPTLFDHL